MKVYLLTTEKDIEAIFTDEQVPKQLAARNPDYRFVHSMELDPKLCPKCGEVLDVSPKGNCYSCLWNKPLS